MNYPHRESAASTSFAVLKREADGATHTATDALAVEEPLEIKLAHGPAGRRSYTSVSVTMRTPGHDAELALGFLFTEGVIGGYRDVASVRFAGAPGGEENVLVVELHAGVAVDVARLERHFYTASSCGVCGKASLEQVRLTPGYYPQPGLPRLAASGLPALPEALLAGQSAFAATGGLHAAGLFDARGELLLLREDVGRHNALDKVLGAAMRKGWLPLREHLALVSGRASFELVQKALMAGLPALAAVGAPSSLAVELAEAYNLSLIGFLRHGRFNVYSGAERIIFAS